MAINVSEVSIGDFCWFKRKNEPKVYTGEIKNIHEKENAITVMANLPLGGFYVIHCDDCWYEDPKIAKRKEKKSRQKNKGRQKEI